MKFVEQCRISQFVRIVCTIFYPKIYAPMTFMHALDDNLQPCRILSNYIEETMLIECGYIGLFLIVVILFVTIMI